MPETTCLLAVGGYGRQALFPYSDVDVLVLLPDGTSAEADEVLKNKIEIFIGSCWDTGLEIGSSVRNLTDCVNEAAADITVQTCWDADRLDLGRVGIRPHPKYLCTAVAKGAGVLQGAYLRSLRQVKR